MNAKQSLSSISANQDLWVQQFRQEMFERDYRSGMSAAENRGHELGLKEGISVGKEHAKLEAARNMLLKKLGTIEQIAEVTGLSEEKIKKLAEKLKIKSQQKQTAPAEQKLTDCVHCRALLHYKRNTLMDCFTFGSQ